MTAPGIEELRAYYTRTPWSHLFLKETLRTVDENTISEAIRTKSVVDGEWALGLDSIFLNESERYLELAVWNFLAYKFLMTGPYLSWAYSTQYFADFYSVNALLRIQGSALVHIKRYEDSTRPRYHIQTLTIKRSARRRHAYYLEGRPRRNEHDFIWNTFFTLYRNWDYKDHGIFYGDGLISSYVRDERATWNYDPFFASQSMDQHAKEEARTMAQTNFLDTFYVSPEHAEFMQEHGWKEQASGDFIRATLDILADIAIGSQFKDHFIGYFGGLGRSIKNIKSNESTKQTILSWIGEHLKQLRAGAHLK